MLPTCIGISGVSRYRNDASIEDSFLPSAMVSSRQTIRDAFKVFLEAFFKVQGGRVQATCPDCAFTGDPYAMANGPDRSNG